jgi:glyoxylase-like metal-dependent hydrolase (beta-lactamase superfamily II)
MSETIGRLNEPAAVRRLTLDDAVCTYIVDGVITVSTDAFFPSIPAHYWAQQTDLLNSQHRVVMSTGGLLVERAGHRVMIDAGAGPLSVDTAAVAVQTGVFLDVLSALEVDRSDIDTLALTHLHLDHTGWAFTPTNDGKMAKTFPNAGYVLSEQ